MSTSNLNEVSVLCDKPAINENGYCNGKGLYGININTFFISSIKKCVGSCKKLYEISSCNPDFIFI